MQALIMQFIELNGVLSIRRRRVPATNFAQKRKDVHALHQAIRAALRSGDNAQPETMLTTETGKRAFAADDRIVFTRNDKDIGVKNGMRGKVVEPPLAIH